MNQLRNGLLFLLLYGLLWLSGCDEEHTDPQPPRVWPRLQIVMEEDTLVYLPGDSPATATIDGWAELKDLGRGAIPGQQVSITLAQPGFGWIDYLNPSLWDTTDGDGRVYFRFRIHDQTGETTVIARAGSATAQWPLVIRMVVPDVHLADMWVKSDTLHVVRDSEDSARVCVRVEDSTGVGVSGILLPLRSPQGGRLAPIPPTNSTGTACTWWYSDGQYGQFEVSVSIEGYAREVSVVVLPW